MAGDWIGSIIITLCVSSFCSIEAQNPIVNFSNVTVQGVLLKTRKGRDVDAFMGIPYAETPIGDLRFRNPIPKVYSEGSTILANKTRSSCLQNMGGLIGDEDCLYLYLYRPSSTRLTSLPVMVYIFAGKFIDGSADVEYTGPAYLLDKDIILVVMNYRLGVFGFLSTGDEIAPGNFGLKDQKLALEWVQNNIAAFGGNPEQVTLFGESSGSACVHLHTLVNHTEGLFNRYILQSGTGFGSSTVREPKSYAERAKQLANISDCPSDSSSVIIDCLRLMESRELFNLSGSIFSETDVLRSLNWGPTKEPILPGAFLTECVEDLFDRDGPRDLPFITGVVKHEGTLRKFEVLGNDTSYDAIYNNIYQFLNTTMDPDWVQLVSQYYFNGIPKDNETIVDRLDDFLNDRNFYHYHVKILEERRKNSRIPFYFYSFEYRGTLSMTGKVYGDNRNVGATHGDDTLYLFYHDPATMKSNLTMNRVDERVIDTVVDLWTSFATNGIPRSRYVEYWTPYDSQGHYMQIGDNKDPGTYLRSEFYVERLKFWANFNQQACE